MFWCRVLDLVISTYFLLNIFMGQSVKSTFICVLFMQDCNDTPVPGTRPLAL